MTALHRSGPDARSGREPVPVGETGGRRRTPLASVLAGGLALIAALTPGCQTPASQEPIPAAAAAPEAHHPREKTYLKRTWGVEVMYVRRTAAGHMLEFRYKVLDPEKAKPLFERRTKPVLTHVETGAQLIVPTPAKTGALRNSNAPIEGRIYWMFFANTGKLVQPGEHVNIEIGAFHADGLVVR